MTKAAIDGEAGLCANKAVGTGALTIVPVSSSRQTGHARTSSMYWIRSTFAGVIRSSSRTNCHAMVSITVSQSGQSLWFSGIGQRTSLTGRFLASPVKEIIAQISGLVKTLDYSSLTFDITKPLERIICIHCHCRCIIIDRCNASFSVIFQFLSGSPG